jgi:hypothetical protein
VGRIGVAMVLGVAAAARPTSTRPPVVAVPVPYAPPGYCWPEVRLFESLRLGPLDYCRKRLTYRPGALECYVVTDNVCWVLQPGGGWIQARSPVSKQVFPCPYGPEPPVCRQLDFE